MKRILTKKKFLFRNCRVSDLLNFSIDFISIEVKSKIFPKKIFLFLIYVFMCCVVQSQILNDDLTLSSQSEVNAFNFIEIAGDLIISGADIVNLSPLSTLTTVEGLQVISNPLLTNLEGLQKITLVDGNLILKDNSALTDLTGLENISTINGYLKILNNDVLISLEKLQSINLVEGSIEVYGNAVITDLTGLQNISSAGGFLKIRSNSALVTIDKLENIKTVEGSLEIYNNDALINLEGLHQIESVGGYLKIESNDAITELDGLRNITSVGSYIEVFKNKFLTNLDGLKKLTFVDGDIVVSNNAVLTEFCGIYSVIHDGVYTGSYIVSDNAVNPTEQEIIDRGSCINEISSPTATIGIPISTGCDSWKVPVTVEDFKNVDAISLKVSFNNSDLTFASADLNLAISSAAINEADGVFSLGYFGNEINLPDASVLFTLNFIVIPAINGTPFNLNWSTVPGECEFAGPNIESIYRSTFIDLNVVKITDEFPKIECPDDIIIENDEGICGAVVTYSVPVGTDNCPDAQTEQISGLPSGAIFPVGSTVNTYKVSDSQGNTNQCSFSITVHDKEAPLFLNCPENVIVETGENCTTCNQVATWTPPTATDNCSLFSIVSNYESGTIFPVGTTKIIYTAFDNNIPANTSTCSFEITVVDNTPPKITSCISAQSAVVTDGCSVQIPSFIGDDISVSDNCGTVSLTQYPEVGEWISYKEKPQNVTITATDESGNSSMCKTTFKVQKAEINGTLVYNNTVKSPMNNVRLILKPGDQICTTDDDGRYKFTGLCAQKYTLKVENNEKSVGYINSTDASAVNKWGTAGGSIDYVNFLAGDVTNDLFINSTDALKIQNYFVYGTDFERNKWSYWEKYSTIKNNTDPFLTPDYHPHCINVDVGGTHVNDIDLYALCTGDFNGSFAPLKSVSSLSFKIKENILIGENSEFEFPLRTTTSMEVGAISLMLDIPSQFVEILDVKVNNSEIPVSWLFKGNELRIGWNSLNPVYVAANEKLVVLKLKTLAAFRFGKTFNLVLINNPLNELADGNSEVIQGATLLAPSICNGISVLKEEPELGLLLFNNYPNPFTNSTTLEYNLPSKGKVNINVYNQLGQLVSKLVNENQVAGKYLIKDWGNDLQPGIYIANLNLFDNQKNITSTIKLSVLK